MGCQKSKEFACVIKDQASPLLRRIHLCDVLVFATPLYFFGPTAQLKTFTDRMYSLFKFDKATRTITHNLSHMKFGVLSTAGSSDFGSLRTLFDVLAGFIGVKVESLLIPFVGQTAALIKSAAIKEKSFIFGRKLTIS
ncbi:MAG: NAD(P)H-dependent oxidoreductase, partial [Candidatus Omnitrophica bacterium]|nr:NAD(P)H-dependent oxidoreductase [Candidatus Omnitrophota bacterium]